MRPDYDVIVVGAGPAGLMAAKTMAGQQLKVALIEKRKDISRWARADCSRIDIWRQPTLADDYTKVGVPKFEDIDEIEAKLNGFSRYATPTSPFAACFLRRRAASPASTRAMLLYGRPSWSPARRG